MSAQERERLKLLGYVEPGTIDFRLDEEACAGE